MSTRREPASWTEPAEDDAFDILIEEHARVHLMCRRTRDVQGAAKRSAFDDLRSLMAVHQTAEQTMVRPLTRDVLGDGLADRRNIEEAGIREALDEMERVGTDSSRFGDLLDRFETMASEHFEREEHDEFKALAGTVDEDEREQIGRCLRRLESMLLTRPEGADFLDESDLAAPPNARLVERVRELILS